jgi:DNA-binding transcriptional LysR family regulator
LHGVQGLDLNLLVALDALLAEGSVTGAARRLHLSVPATSRVLGRVRDALGDEVLVRAGRGLVPTPRALALRERVRRTVDDARAIFAAGPGEPARTVTLRVDDAVIAIVAPALLAAVRRHAPGITLTFAAEGDEDVGALRDGRVDLDIGVQGPLGPEIRSRYLLDDRLVVIAHRARRGRLTLARFAAAEHVAVSRRGRRRGPVDDALARRGLARTVRVVVPDQLAAAVVVAQTDLIALVSERFAAAIARRLPVRSWAVPVALPAARVAMAWHPRFDDDPAHRWVRDRIIALVGFGG